MLTSDFDFNLPEQLIAQRPLESRTDSRLLHCACAQNSLHDRQFLELVDLLQAGDLLVMNNTRVFPARIYGQKETGGKVEILVERLLGATQARCMLKSSRSPKSGSQITLEGGAKVTLLKREADLFVLEIIGHDSLLHYLNENGHIPLPPYIERSDDKSDIERYQTVFAEQAGAVAAPTAGLHFDEPLLEKLRQKGINTAYITLNVGPGTFQPVRAEKIEDHQLHAEFGHVSEAVAQHINETKAAGNRVVAVGTTVVRTLETASQSGSAQAFSGDTALFIKPGYQFKIIDALVTNFHLPKSSLLMLVSALAGYDFTMQAYQHAVAAAYRFYSYGDAMFIEANS